ncbi:MAG: hypothetical protein LH471_01770 [Salinibacterium sp.]|nr:hypothetical protein [Salinibacterium sp.]
MHQLPLDEILGAALETWYARVTEWVPPGIAIDRLCTECDSSTAATILENHLWPHSIVHELTVVLAILERQLSESVAEDRLERARSSSVAVSVEVRAVLAARVLAAREDIVDVLEQCLRPRLDAWVAGQVEACLDAIATCE